METNSKWKNMEAGVQRLSSHFTWPEFCDKRRDFHQDFVYNVTMFAAACGLPWSDVTQAALMAKALFPQLDGADLPTLLALLKDMLSEYLSNLSAAQQLVFAQFLADVCIRQRALFQAVLSGAAEESVIQLRMEVQSPPIPCPLAQGTDLEEWECQENEAELRSLLHQKEEKLKQLRSGERVSVEEIKMPEEGDPDREMIFITLDSALKSTKEQMLASLTQEVNLLTDILHIKLQKAELIARKPHLAAAFAIDDGPAQAEPAAKKSAKKSAKAKGRK